MHRLLAHLQVTIISIRSHSYHILPGYRVVTLGHYLTVTIITIMMMTILIITITSNHDHDHHGDHIQTGYPAVT